jgi:hypothetical protein
MPYKQLSTVGYGKIEIVDKVCLLGAIIFMDIQTLGLK